MFLLLLASLAFASARQVCHICGPAGNNALKYPDIVLSGVAKSCIQIAMEVALATPPETARCRREQKTWYEPCCSGNRPEGHEESKLPPQNVPVVKYTGPHPVCHVCRDGDYPFNTGMVINFLYIGEGSCAQYYKYGREGRIARRYCAAVQYFSYEPCGCGEFNPYFNLNPQCQVIKHKAVGVN